MRGLLGKIENTIAQLKTLKKDYDNFNIGVLLTVNPIDQERVLPQDPSVHPRFEGFFSAMAAGVQTVSRFFDLGDSVDSGYRTSYMAVGRRIRRLRGVDDGPRYYEAGLHNVAQVSHALDDHACTRTVQRWLRQLGVQALEIQQAIRSALIERCEPRPVEHLFPGGLSPPESLARRPWREPDSVATLHRALTMLFVGVIELDLPTAVLLAEARGGMTRH